MCSGYRRLRVRGDVRMVLRVRWLAVAVAVVLAVAGCSWSRSRPRQSLPYYCTPGPVEVGSPPPVKQECTQEAYEKDQQRLELEKKALIIHADFNREYQRWVRAGGSLTLPANIEDCLADPMKIVIGNLLATQKQEGRTVKGEFPKLSERVIPNPHQDGSEVALLTCTDNRGSTMYESDGTKFKDGRVTVSTRLLKRYPDGKMRLFYTEGEQEDSCPFE